MMTRIEPQDVITEVKRAVPLRQTFELLGWRTYHGKRAECRLCRGNRHETIAFSDSKGLWHCKRCDEGGSVFDLIMLAHSCSFIDALKLLAEEARIQLPTRTTPEERQRLRREHQEREQRGRELDLACAEIERQERSLRIECVERIRQCDAALTAPAPWNEAHWLRAKVALVLRDEFLLPEFTVLAFAAMDDRLRYLISDERERARMLAAVRWVGGVMADADHFVSVGVVT